MSAFTREFRISNLAPLVYSGILRNGPGLAPANRLLRALTRMHARRGGHPVEEMLNNRQSADAMAGEATGEGATGRPAGHHDGACPGVHAMPTAFRVTACAGGPIGDADTIDGVLELAKGAAPGRYRIDKISLDHKTGDVRSWEWGEVVKDPDGGIRLDLPPWID
jgi:hypothetical protein